MAECRWCKDEICVNADCPMCCDYCPVPDTEGLCRFEDRGDENAEYIERETIYADFEKCNAENPKWTPNRVKSLIARQPAADVAPVRHGRWVENGIPDSILDGCSECGFLCGAYSFRYCPACGARMDG